MKNKKANIQWASIITTIAVVLTIIVLLGWSNVLYGESKYEAMSTGCSILSDSIHGDPTFFTSLNEPNELLGETLAKSCPSKDIKISSNSIKRAADLAKECWSHYGNGADILSSQSYGQNICIKCGLIEADSDINNFDDKFLDEVEDINYNKLFEEADTINLNLFTLNEKDSLPQNIEKGENLMVYYFIHKPNFDFEIGDDFIENYAEIFLEYYADPYSDAVQFISEFGFVGSKFAQFMPGDFEMAMSGVAIEEFRADNHEFNTEEGVFIDMSGVLKAKCSNFISPLENFG